MSVRPDETESKENAEFRREVRAWIAANKPAHPGFKLPQSFLEVESARQFEFLREWQRKVFDAGYLGLDWPAEYGGKGDPLKRQRIVSQELNRAGAPFLVNVIGLQWAGPTILAVGNEEQKKRFLKPILSAEEIWCQGFSEPGAGSDLASLTAIAEPTDDGWLVTGHKVWTTLAHFAKWMILLARTDQAAHKYAGISYFLFPMDAPNVTVQPLVKMSGEGGFNQVIFDKAPMPKSALLGQLGQGWQIAMTTLTFERGAAEGTGGGQTTPTESSARAVARLASARPPRRPARRRRRGDSRSRRTAVDRGGSAAPHQPARARRRSQHGRPPARDAPDEQARVLGTARSGSPSSRARCSAPTRRCGSAIRRRPTRPNGRAPT